MRRAALVVLMAALMAAWPAHAQLFPTASQPGAPATTTERVLVDATFRAIPPVDPAPCMLIDAGTLTVRVQSGDQERPTRPTTLTFTGYRGSDPAAQFELRVNQQESAVTVPLIGGLYCWSLSVEAPVKAEDSMAVRTNYAQIASVRMAYTAP